MVRLEGHLTSERSGRCCGLVIALALLIVGCGSRAGAPAPTADTGASQSGVATDAGPETAPSDGEAAVPLADVRQISAFPARYLGHLIDCDMQQVGPLRESPANDIRLRRLGLSHTRSVRCSSGFIQLAFRPSSSALAAFIRPNRRLRARVRDLGRERFHTPIVEFVAQADEDLATPEAPEALFAPLPVGDDLRPAAVGAAGNQARICVLAWVGNPLELPHDPNQDRPAPVYSLPVSCHHATGDAWVELRIDSGAVESMLAKTRGDRLPLRITSLAGGRGGYPLASLAD